MTTDAEVRLMTERYELLEDRVDWVRSTCEKAEAKLMKAGKRRDAPLA